MGNAATRPKPKSSAQFATFTPTPGSRHSSARAASSSMRATASRSTSPPAIMRAEPSSVFARNPSLHSRSAASSAAASTAGVG